MKTERIVYTCIIGGYDRPKPLTFPRPHVRAVLFTDNTSIEAPGWDVQPLQWSDDPDPIRQARWHKHHPLSLFPHASASVWMDGTHEPAVPVSDLFRLLGKYDMAAFRHSWWNTIKREAEEILKWKRDDPAAVARTLATLRREGFVDNRGLWCSGVLIRRHTKAVDEAQTLWWRHIRDGSRRDQLTLPLVVQKTELGIASIPGSCWHGRIAGRHQPNPYFFVTPHTPAALRKKG